MKTLFTTLVLGSAFALVAQAQSVATTPVGHVIIPCLANSDTIVGVPLKQPTVAGGALSANPSVAGGSATLTLNGTNLGSLANTHYVKFTTGAASGKYYAITANTATTLTVDLNGDSLGAVQNDKLSVTKFWTLAELFNPAEATTDPATTGNAIVASTSTLAAGRRTELLLPDTASAGINLAPQISFYVHNGIWKKVNGDNTDMGTQQLWPDTYFVIRHHPSVTAATNYSSSGEVEMQNFRIPLATLTSGPQDNYVALLRPANVSLNQLALGGTAAFVESIGTLVNERRDELLVYDNTAALLNKTPSATYYRHSGIWKKVNSGNTNFGTTVIPMGAGIVVRKYATATGATVFWNNTQPY